MKRERRIGGRLNDDLKPEHQSADPREVFASEASEAKAMSLITDLGLTDSQESAIRLILEADKPAIELLNSQLVKNHRQLYIAVRSRLFNKERLRPLLTQRTQIKAELLAAREHLKSRIYDALTPDQRAVLERKRNPS